MSDPTLNASPTGVHGLQHGNHHPQDHHANADHGSLKSYLTGFVLSVILTAIPFWLVMGKVIEKSSTLALVVLAFAAVQIVVHMVYFLHMNAKSENGWTLLALIFTVVLVVITLSGSIWVLYHLDHNMMPGMMEDPTQEMSGMAGDTPMHDPLNNPAADHGIGMRGHPAMK